MPHAAEMGILKEGDQDVYGFQKFRIQSVSRKPDGTAVPWGLGSVWENTSVIQSWATSLCAATNSFNIKAKSAVKNKG